MTPAKMWIALVGLTRKEVLRWLRIWPQSILPPIITSNLYFLIFGSIIGERVGSMVGVPYMVFIAPGLVLMSVITNAYANVTSSFYGARFARNIDELLVSPMPNWLIILGFVAGGTLRGMTTGAITFLVASCYAGFHLQHPLEALLALFLCSSLFSLAGFLNGLFARKFDDTAIFVTFILTPLIYLGGVFYSVNELKGIWHTLSKFNPVYYIISLFRDAMLGLHEHNSLLMIGIITGFVVSLFTLNLVLINKGVRIKS